MSNDESVHPDRRNFLRAGAATLATAAATTAGAAPQDAPAAKPAEIPKRKLGKTGVEVTLLDQGVIRGPSFDRLVRFAFGQGIRVFDTARVYGTEPGFKRWFEKDPDVRKQIFLVTKDNPRTPADLPKMLDKRLETLGTDYVDLFFIHGLGDEHSLDDAMNFVKGAEFKAVAEAIRKSGKARFVGFSSHHKNRAQIIQAAAEGGVVDAIML
ncbi:MAG TPA: aldo/keto reductase [Isosphaeraceae bacterium]|jgi:hypothetical protein|nr:aldo/keto reductase [Isosphaeraceae bacterium]